MLKAAACAAITLMIPFNAYAAYIPETGTAISLETAGIYLDGVYMGHDGNGAFIGEKNLVPQLTLTEKIKLLPPLQVSIL